MRLVGGDVQAERLRGVGPDELLHRGRVEIPVAGVLALAAGFFAAHRQHFVERITGRRPEMGLADTGGPIAERLEVMRQAFVPGLTWEWFGYAPVRTGYSPVSNACRIGEQTEAGEKKPVSLSPSLASRSRCGVFASVGPPKQATSCQDRSSAMKMTMLGLDG